MGSIGLCLMCFSGLLSSNSSRTDITVVWWFTKGLAPAYLRNLRCPVVSALGRRSLYSTDRCVLIIPFVHTKQNGAFSVLGPPSGTVARWRCACSPESTLCL